MQGKLTISKNNKGIVNIDLTDEISGIRLIDLTMELSVFADALFGLAYQECSYELSPHSQYVGQVRISKPLVVEVKKWGDIEEAKTLLKEALEASPELSGWNSSFNLSTRGSFYTIDNKVFAKTSMYKFVPVDSIEATTC